MKMKRPSANFGERKPPPNLLQHVFQPASQLTAHRRWRSERKGGFRSDLHRLWRRRRKSRRRRRLIRSAGHPNEEIWRRRMETFFNEMVSLQTVNGFFTRPTGSFFSLLRKFMLGFLGEATIMIHKQTG